MDLGYEITLIYLKTIYISMRDDLEYDYKFFNGPKEITDYFNDPDNDAKEIVSVVAIERSDGYRYEVFYKIDKTLLNS